ncbi:MAG: hypothetical protein H6684_13925 [Deltaproteobacteria bacterium]|nr:hypothetical protein [Deltaproteobacteria bacterium]MCB9478643.1 hypothetical protein [Deltaproteobacteria bacterium]MCB9489826.1 hypothetical protein [Deltaproteobacteria bacterium]
MQRREFLTVLGASVAVGWAPGLVRLAHAEPEIITTHFDPAVDSGGRTIRAAYRIRRKGPTVFQASLHVAAKETSAPETLVTVYQSTFAYKNGVYTPLAAREACSRRIRHQGAQKVATTLLFDHAAGRVAMQDTRAKTVRSMRFEERDQTLFLLLARAVGGGLRPGDYPCVLAPSAHRLVRATVQVREDNGGVLITAPGDSLGGGGEVDDMILGWSPGPDRPKLRIRMPGLDDVTLAEKDQDADG